MPIITIKTIGSADNIRLGVYWEDNLVQGTGES